MVKRQEGNNQEEQSSNNNQNQNMKLPSWISNAIFMFISIGISSFTTYFYTQRTTEVKIAVIEQEIQEGKLIDIKSKEIEEKVLVIETKLKTQEEEQQRQRNLISSTIEPRLNAIEQQLVAIRTILEQQQKSK